MQVNSRSSKPSISKTSSKTASKTSAPRSTGSVKKTATTSTTAKPAAPKDTFVASQERGKPNSAVPNFGSWAMATPPSPQAAAKAFDDTSWAAAQARHTADFAHQAGNALKSQPLSQAGASALKPLNPAAGVLGGAALGKQAYDSYEKGNYTDAALQGATSGTLLSTTAGVVKGGQAVAKLAGRAAPAVGGALQAYEGIKSGDRWDTVSGGAKIAGAAMIATGFGAPVGSALVIGSFMADLGRWGYQKLTQ